MIRVLNPLQSRTANNINHTIIDYRNGKYQGTIQTQSRQPNGIGMFLSQDYHLVVGFWKNGQIQGQSLIVFPNGNMAFGSFSKNQPKDMVCFQLANGKILYTFTYNNKESLCLLEDSYNKLLTVVRMHKDSKSQFFDGMRAKGTEMSTDQIKQQKGIFFRKKIQIVQEIRYENEVQKWMKIEQYSKQLIKSQYKGYKSFIRFNFCSLPQNHIQLTQTKQQVQLRFKKSSIICHLIENNNNQNTLRVKLLGYYDENNRKMEICRKSVPGIAKEYEQICEDQSFMYTNKRPPQAKQKFINYLKKSTHFANIYIKTKDFQFIRAYFQSLYEIIENEMSSKKAQTLLQLAQPLRELSPAQRQKYKDQLAHKKRNYQIQLSEVKNSVLNKVSRRKNSNYDRQKSLSSKKLIQHSQNFSNKKMQRYGQQKENYYSPQRLKGIKYGENSPSKQKKYLIYAQKSPYRTSQTKVKNYQSPSRSRHKKYTYISQDHHNQSINALENQKYNKKHLILDLYHSRSQYKLQQDNKFNNYDRYQDLGKRRRENNHNQSIKYLTKDYQLINQKLTIERESSNRKDFQGKISRNNQHHQNSRSPKKFSYLKSPMISPTSQSSKIKKQWR